jgi:acyl carrier protein
MLRAMGTDTERIRAEVCELIARHSGLDLERIGPEDRLLHDLGIDGDDAEKLLVDFSKRFGVDMSDFKFGNFFRGEASYWKISSGSEPLALTVDDLCGGRRW